MHFTRVVRATPPRPPPPPPVRGGGPGPKVIGVAVLGAAGVGYYLYTQPEREVRYPLAQLSHQKDGKTDC